MINLRSIFSENAVNRLVDVTVFLESSDIESIGGFSLNISIKTWGGVVRPLKTVINSGSWDLFDADLISGNFSAISTEGKKLQNNTLITLFEVSFDVLQESYGFYTIEVNSTGQDTFFDGDGSVVPYASTSLSIAPPPGGVFISGEVSEGSTLIASHTLTDADGIPATGVGALYYQWQSGGVDIIGATTSALLLTPYLVGKTISVFATYTDFAGHLESFSSQTTTAVANVNDSPTGSVTITGTATQGQVLSASNTLSDLDGIPAVDAAGAISYQWRAGGVKITDATSSTLVLDQAKVGKAITVVATYTDRQGTAESVESTATGLVANINDSPTGGVTITGTATHGQTLTAANTLADVDGIPVSGVGAIIYQWSAGGAVIANATGSTYVLTQAEVGKAITVTASYTDQQGTAESKTSSATASVANINDSPTGGVTITGTATQGQTLTAANTLADIDGIPESGVGAISYQWSAGGAAIANATGITYVLTQAEVGKAITVTASYTDQQGTAESVTSTATAAVANVNDAPTGTARMLSTESVASTRELLASDITNTATQKFNTANSHIYEYVDANVTWTAAKTAAEAKTLAGLTGYLVTITSASEQSFVLANNVTSVGRWLGASDAATEGTWRWVTGPEEGLQFWSGSSGGSAVNGAYKNWESDEPNNSADDDYAHFWPSSGLWNDAPNAGIVIGSNPRGWVGGYVVEYSGTVNTSGSQVPSNTESHFTEDRTLYADGSLLGDPDGMGALSYQWQRATDANANGSIEATEWSNIQSAIATTYTLGDADSGGYIRLAIGYTDALGTQETVYSGSSLAIKNINDEPTGGVTISGTATQGQVLTASNTLADLDGIPESGVGAIGYQWQWSIDGNMPWTSIDGTLGDALKLSSAHLGHHIRVLGSYTDEQGLLEAVASHAVWITLDANFVAYSWKAHTLLAGVDLTAGTHSSSTDSMGAAGFKAITQSNLSLNASRTVPADEAQATTNAVNLQDAIAILKMIVGLNVNGANQPLSPYQALAADFDGNSRVELNDAIGVLKHVVGLTGTGTPKPEWRFVDEANAAVVAIKGNAALSPGQPPAINLDLTGADATVQVGLVGYLRGDVDGSFAGAAGALDLDGAQPGYFTDLVAAQPALNLAQFGIYG